MKRVGELNGIPIVWESYLDKITNLLVLITKGNTFKDIIIRKSDNIFKSILKKQTTNTEYVDLGLPSGTLWATCNVGATKPEEYGLYFQLGDTIGYEGDDAKAHSTWETTPFNNGSSDYDSTYFASVKDTVFPNGVLAEKYDAAHVHMGGDWRMPTKEEMSELRTNTTLVWTQVNGVNGVRFTSKTNGNSMFVPASGYFHYGDLYSEGSVGYLWSSFLSVDFPLDAWYMGIDSGFLDVAFGLRFDSFPVRGVMAKPQNSILPILSDYNAMFLLPDTTEDVISLKLCDNLSNIESYQVEGYETVLNPTSKTFDVRKSKATKYEDLDVFKVKFTYTDSVTATSIFKDCNQLIYIDIDDILGQNNNITDVSSLFCDCLNLIQIDNMHITDNCTNLSYLFKGCKKLATVQNIENWDTSNVADMSYTFSDANSHGDILANKINDWDTGNVEDMTYIFANSLVTTINVSKWNVSNVKLMGGLISNCTKLTNMDMSNWNTQNVTTITGFALRCRAAGSNVKMFKHFENVQYAPQAFSDAYSFMSKAEVEAMHLPKVENIDFIFGYTNPYTELDLSGWGITSNCVKLRYLFENNLRSLDISGWDLSRAALYKDSGSESYWNTTMFYRNSDTSQMLSNLEYIIMEGCNSLTLDFIYSIKPPTTKIYLDKSKTLEYTK